MHNKLLKGDIGKLLNQALGKEANDLPYLIFIDLNSPLTPEVDFVNKPWIKDIDKRLSSLKKLDNNNDKFKFGSVFVTNFSHHYEKDKLAQPLEFLEIVHPFYSRNMNQDMLNNIRIQLRKH